MAVIILPAGPGLATDTCFIHTNHSDTSLQSTITLARYNSTNWGISNRTVSISLTAPYQRGGIKMVRGNNQKWMLLPCTQWDQEQGVSGSTSTPNTHPWKPYFSTDNGTNWTAGAPPIAFTGVITTDLVGVPDYEITNAEAVEDLDGNLTWVIGMRRRIKATSGSSVVEKDTIYYSTDDGATWTEIGAGYGQMHLMGSGKYNLLACKLDTFNDTDGVQWVSYDHGQTWHSYATIDADPTNDAALLCRPSAARGTGVVPNWKNQAFYVRSFAKNDTWTTLGGGSGSSTHPAYNWVHKYFDGNPDEMFTNNMRRIDLDAVSQTEKFTSGSGHQQWEYLYLGNLVWVRVQYYELGSGETSGMTWPRVEYSTNNGSSWTVDSTDTYYHIHSGTNDAGYYSWTPTRLMV